MASSGLMLGFVWLCWCLWFWLLCFIHRGSRLRLLFLFVFFFFVASFIFVLQSGSCVFIGHEHKVCPGISVRRVVTVSRHRGVAGSLLPCLATPLPTNLLVSLVRRVMVGKKCRTLLYALLRTPLRRTVPPPRLNVCANGPRYQRSLHRFLLHV